MPLFKTACLWMFVCIALACIPSAGLSQVARPYHMNGDAFQENCNCYTLTPDQFDMSGSVWNINKIDLNEPFDFKFTVFLGCHDNDGADGIAFVLQPISTSIGAVGGGIGYDGVSPSIGVLVDTWQNFEDNDPDEDHIAIHKNGFIDHSALTDVTSPVPALPSGANIEDCNWHILRITWEPIGKNLSVEFDGHERLAVNYDLIEEIFNGDPMVFWGFTAATGGAKNHQRVCTSLDPKFIFPEGQTTCFPEPVQLVDSSVSFGSIDKWFWDFGDGTTWESSSAPPPHHYVAPGEYQASLKILGNDGCLSEPFVKTIVMGTDPVANFNYTPHPVCEGVPVSLLDASEVEFGTISQWNWSMGGEVYSGKDPPPVLVDGRLDVHLDVRTREGCFSGQASSTLVSHPIPEVEFAASDICITEPLRLEGQSQSATVAVQRWVWEMGDGAVRNTLNPDIDYKYRKGGSYQVKLTGYSAEGCASMPVIRDLDVYETNAFAGNDTIVAENQPVTLQASGGEYYQWSPSAGLSADNIPNPVATLSESRTYVLRAFTEAGCATTDSINIKVYKGPAFYVPSAFSPNGDGKNDDFRFIAVGMTSIDLFQVFNRYGQLVYSSTQHMKGWDGRMNGQTQPSGTYVWVVRGTDFNGAIHTQKGTVTLVR